jgi:hypothetical protein
MSEAGFSEAPAEAGVIPGNLGVSFIGTEFQ